MLEGASSLVLLKAAAQTLDWVATCGPWSAKAEDVLDKVAQQTSAERIGIEMQFACQAGPTSQDFDPFS